MLTSINRKLVVGEWKAAREERAARLLGPCLEGF